MHLPGALIISWEIHKQHVYCGMGSPLPIRGSRLGNTIAVAIGTCLCGRLPIREHFGEYDVLQQGYGLCT